LRIPEASLRWRGSSWFRSLFLEKKVEPNSVLGKAINYMVTHWEKLTLFLKVAGVPLDNTICERALKMAILLRKNALLCAAPHYVESRACEPHQGRAEALCSSS